MYNSVNWSLVCHSDTGQSGTVAVIKPEGKATRVINIGIDAASGQAAERKPVFLGLTPDDKVLLMDPATKKITVNNKMPSDAFPAYAYPEHGAKRMWFVYDGDPKTGNDTLNCGDCGSSTTVVGNGTEPAVLKTICVGRGHHGAAFTAPCVAAPEVPLRAFVSNLMDGTLSVIGNDPADTDTYLQVIGTINLCEPDKEKGGEMCVPNNAFPHGMAYSPVNGKLYSLNNGYGTVTVVDPTAMAIENTIALRGCSNLLLSPDGRFVIGKGADRKSNPEHVIGIVAVLDVEAGTVATTLELPDLYPSTYRFNRDGSRLYVTSAATGNEAQRGSLKTDTLYVFDTTDLPNIRLIKEVTVGLANCGRRPMALYEADGVEGRVFIPNPTDGTVTILNAADDTVIETVKIAEGPAKEVLFSFWDGSVSGC